MKRVEFWRWMIPSSTKPGRLERSRWDMTEEEARQRYPGCERVPNTLVVRDLPETSEELLRLTTSGLSATAATPPPAPYAGPDSPPLPAPGRP
jgi:hypothetical protein